MAQVGEISQVLSMPVEEAEKANGHHIPVLNWVLGVVLAVIVSTVTGLIWLSHEAAANNPAFAAFTLFGTTSLGATRALFAPLLFTATTWCLLAVIGIRSVSSWGSEVIGTAQRTQLDLQSQVDDLQTRLNLAQTGTEFWKTQARRSEEAAQSAEASRQELEGRMEQLSVRERQLAREQEELSRSKDRLERHVEARTIELHRLQQRYVSILNYAGEGICSFDMEDRITFANPAAIEMMSWSADELLGMKYTAVFADHGHKNDLKTEDGEPEVASHPAPVVFQRKDKSTFPVEMVRTPVEENGRQVGSVLIFKDVTERTEADERFSAKVAELARSNSELEQFAFVASHDLQEPLRKIQAFGDRLKTRMGEDTAPEALDYLNRMQSASARMQGLIDGLLMYSRVLTRAQPFSHVKLKTIIREVIEDLEVRIEKSNATVEVGDLPGIEADALQIRQLLQNLIGNALKFQSSDNKPHVKVSSRILLGGSPKGLGSGNTEFLSRTEMCELTIEDNGIGFDESYLKRLFVVFQRLHSRSEFEGTGIGLAVCRKIVTRHGGYITAASTPGKGSKFIVLLPLRQNADRGGIA